MKFVIANSNFTEFLKLSGKELNVTFNISDALKFDTVCEANDYIRLGSETWDFIQVFMTDVRIFREDIFSLSNEDKIKLCELAFALIKKGKNDFICTAISEAQNSSIEGHVIKGYNSVPEILKYKPTGVILDHAWWYGTSVGELKRTRLEVLQKVIKDLSE